MYYLRKVQRVEVPAIVAAEIVARRIVALAAQLLVQSIVVETVQQPVQKAAQQRVATDVILLVRFIAEISLASVLFFSNEVN